jgi:hypothetical protein
MTRPVRDPGLRLARGEVQGDEGAAEVVDTELAPIHPVVVELVPGDSREQEVSADHVGQPPVDWAAVLVGEQPISRLRVATLQPRPERGDDARIQRPHASVVGLVLVQGDRSTFEVNVNADPQRDGLATP